MSNWGPARDYSVNRLGASHVYATRLVAKNVHTAALNTRTSNLASSKTTPSPTAYLSLYNSTPYYLGAVGSTNPFQTVGTSPEVIEYDTVEADGSSMYDAATQTITIPDDGVYEMAIVTTYDPTNAFNNYNAIQFVALNNGEENFCVGAGGETSTLISQAAVALNAGDELQVKIFADSGTAALQGLRTDGTTYATADNIYRASYFTLQKI